MLILSDPDGAGVDFYEFSEWVLQSVGDTDSAADCDIEVGVFGDSGFTGGVDGGTGFAD